MPPVEYMGRAGWAWRRDPRQQPGAGWCRFSIWALIAIAAALLWATIASLDGWAHAIVIAMVVTTTIGLTTAISPGRADA